MQIENLQTKIFLDSGDPQDTETALNALGFLDGQTTNPSLIAKSPRAKTYLDSHGKFKPEELIQLYKESVQQISQKIPHSSVSIEVIATADSTSDELYQQAIQNNKWIPNAHIKFPITPSGLEAAHRSVLAGLRVNMTLCFNQMQGAAVYSATQNANRGDVFISPFIGRLDDRGEKGIDLVVNLQKMYNSSDHHVQVLAASIRNLDRFMECLYHRVDIITAPLQVLLDWKAQGCKIPTQVSDISQSNGITIPFTALSVDQPYQEYDISHPLTDTGLAKFTSDWEALLS